MLPGAFKKTIREGDIRMLIDHEGTPIARSKRGDGTLRLAEDSQGLQVEAQLDEKNPRIQELASAMDRGDMDGMSIGFFTVDDDMEHDPEDGGMPQRSLREVSLNDGDVSPVTYPAFVQTSSQLRSVRRVLEAHGLSTAELDYEAALRTITASAPANWDGNPEDIRDAIRVLERFAQPIHSEPQHDELAAALEPDHSTHLLLARSRQAQRIRRLALAGGN